MIGDKSPEQAGDALRSVPASMPESWRIDARLFEFDSTNTVDIRDEDNFSVCAITPLGGDWSTEEIQRVYLIAAAPDLLEALKEAVAYLDVAFPLESGGFVRDSIRRGRAAIAKAHGERPGQLEAQQDSGVAKP